MKTNNTPEFIIPDYTIDEQDLQILFLHTKNAYIGYSFERWCIEIKEVYAKYFNDRFSPKSFFEWVNGQIIYLTTACF